MDPSDMFVLASTSVSAAIGIGALIVPAIRRRLANREVPEISGYFEEEDKKYLEFLRIRYSTLNEGRRPGLKYGVRSVQHMLFSQQGYDGNLAYEAEWRTNSQ